jgi:hypothetical protein
MRKNLFRTMLMTSILATSLLVGCGEKDTKVESTTPIESTGEVESTTMEETTPIVEGTTSEEVTNEVEEPTSPSEEVTTEAPTTEEPTTIVEETTTSKVEETTKAPEPTTQAPTQAPTEAPTPVPTPSVNDAAIAKIKSLHIAYRPEESNMEWDEEGSNELGGFVFRPGENYRKMADYVDDYGDGTKPNPYVMHEWTTRKYWGDRDEETLGYYCYKEDIDQYNNPPYNGICEEKVKEISKVYDNRDGCDIYIGTYEGRDIYFKYYFLRH